MRMLSSVLQDLNANRLRSAITVASVIIGVVALVSTALIGLISQDVFVAREEQQTARAATVRADFDSSDNPTRDAVTLWQALGDRLSPGDGNAVVTWEGSGDIVDGPQQVSVVSVLGRYSASRRLPMTSTSDNEPDGRRIAFVNTRAGVRLGSTSLLTPGSRPAWDLDVRGIVADAESGSRIYLPVTASEAEDAAFQLQAGAPALLLTVGEGQDGAAEALINDLSDRLGLSAAPTVARFDSVPAVRAQIDTLRTLFTVVAVVALSLSSLGILNIGLASVTFRTRELAIRRSLGANRRDLFSLVLGSAVAGGLLAALLGIAATALILRFVLPVLLPGGSAVTIPGMPATAVLQAIVAAVGTAAAGAAIPAWRASRVEIASVLRD
ncbi:FtsX-like permease family protein [Nocardioides sp. InS609-2]|uniref:ABC transporter permease n=1 Tax=Nocardioides sp. InS609-2 TaxID=2760705 RepID=UPI0020C0ECD0|nr:FtsX-like permease family protein [Nocardioides sp. InS609-2]